MLPHIGQNQTLPRFGTLKLHAQSGPVVQHDGIVPRHDLEPHSLSIGT